MHKRLKNKSFLPRWGVKKFIIHLFVHLFVVCVCVCTCVCPCICPCKCALVSVGGRNICLLAASFPQVLSNGDKGMACGKIDRRMLFIPTGPPATVPPSQRGEEGVGGKEMNLPEESDD